MSDPTSRLNRALEGRYRIERELGEGGMATVYLADDLKHERKVALKVLKPELAAVVGGERFLAEIKTTANLQHPHILPLFDSGEADGFLFYVMPYVEGETLRDRIDRERQLPVDEALGIATAVAGALQTAHDQGIVHRDIKPGNILLSRGQPLVADFGIAIAVSAGGGGRLTETGLSLGTPYYMSPEQATGDQYIGPASDTFALACVLYEMLTGEPPYPGSTAQAVLGRIIQGLPVSATAVRKSVPANVDAAIRRALEKLPADRFTGAQDFARALADPSFRHGETGDPDVATAPGSAVRLPFVAAIAVAMLGAGYGLSQVGRSDPLPDPSARFVVTGDSAHTLVSPCCGRAVAVSPNGSRLVYQGSSGGTMQLYQRPLDEEVGIPIPGTEEGRHPFFSPDGEWLGFFAGDALKKVRFDGGTPFTVTSDIRGPNAGAAWSEQGVIVFGVQGVPGLLRVSADGGTPEVVTATDTAAAETNHRWPHLLPGGETILFSVTITQEGTQRHVIASVPIEGGPHAIVGDGSDPRFVDSGHLIYGDGTGSLMAQAFDPKRLELEGARFRIAEGATYRGLGTGMTEYDISRTGTLFFRKGPALGAASDRTLQLVDMEGNVEDVATLGPIRHPRWSPSGRYIAYELEGVGSADNRDDVWVWDLERSVQIRVTFEDDNSYPVWGLDDDRLIFETVSTISTRAADGSGATEVLYRAPGNKPPYLTPDGEWLLWTSLTGEGGIFIAPADGSGEPRALIETPFTVFTPAVSPDGRWIAYTSDESGVPEIYVEPFPDRGAKFKLTSGSAWSPLWSPSGDRLYYRRRNPPIDLVSVEVRPGEGFDVGEHRTLFETRGYPIGLFRLYDISPDGNRFVFVGGADEATSDVGDTNVVITNALNPGLEDGAR